MESYALILVCAALVSLGLCKDVVEEDSRKGDDFEDTNTMMKLNSLTTNVEKLGLGLQELGFAQQKFKVEVISMLKKIQEHQNYEIVDGGFAEWGPWDYNCNSIYPPYQCGNAPRTRSRSCTNPSPEYGGKACEGAYNETMTCKINCPEGVVAVFPGQCNGYADESTYNSYDECLKLCIRKNATWCSYRLDIRCCFVYTHGQITGGDGDYNCECMKMAK